MSEKPNVLRETDDQARRLARVLLRSARYAAVAVVDPESGDPFASRVLVGTDVDGTPVVLVSSLSAHTKGLASDGRASLLAGEPGKGDPLAHPRITVQCRAERISREASEHGRIRARFLRRHPKAELYADFGDFSFFRLNPISASLNGGFGRAYALTRDDLLIASPAIAGLAEMEGSAVDHMNTDHAEAATIYARAYAGAKEGEWRITGLDAAGIDLQSGDRQARVEYDSVLSSTDELRPTLIGLLQKAR